VPFQRSVNELYSTLGIQSALNLKASLPLSRVKLAPLETIIIVNGTPDNAPDIVEIEPAEQEYKVKYRFVPVATIEALVPIAAVPVR